jgi:nucleotidyltransferase/DNA polymerase involved in DNA repair
LYELGLTASIGIGSNKLVAKLISKRHKPDQVTTLVNRAIQAYMHQMPLIDLPFFRKQVPAAARQVLLEHFAQSQACSEVDLNEPEQVLQYDRMAGITIDSVLALTLQELIQLLQRVDATHKQATWLYHACRGQEYSSVVEKRTPASVSVSMSLTPIKNDLLAVDRILQMMCKDLAAKLKLDCASMSSHPVADPHLSIHNALALTRQQPILDKLVSSKCAIALSITMKPS